MRRFALGAAIALAVLALGTAAVFAQDASARQLALQRLQQQRAASREAGAAAAAQPTVPTTTPTIAPTPTFIPRPLPTPTPTPAPTFRPTFTTTTTAVPTTPTSRPVFDAGAPPKATASVKPAVAPSPRVDPNAGVEKLRNTREDRRHAEIERLHRRWGELVSDERSKVELELHAKRVAYLQRIRSVAEKAGDAKTVQAVDELIVQEERRDAEALNALRSGSPGSAK
ncbi:MAG TPA: hypothetical protein VJT73_05510 [Polyangiaceae bacterium]|nr:hypothetical protein [Polyangiaceae bacterium]